MYLALFYHICVKERTLFMLTSLKRGSATKYLPYFDTLLSRYSLAYVYSEDSNQSVRPHSLISVLVLLVKKRSTVGYPGDLCWSGSIIRKSRFIFTKERRTIRQKSGCLNHSNEQIFQVNIQMQEWIIGCWKGVWGSFC